MALAAAADPVHATRADLIEEWTLNVGIIGEHSVFEFFNVVSTPFSGSHQVVIGPSQSSASYTFFWQGLNGDFMIQGSQTALDIPSGFLESIAVGRVVLTPSEDLVLTFDSSYAYDLPPDSFVAQIQFSVARLDPFAILLSAGQQATSLNGHAIGTLEIADSLVLPAGGRYQVRYEMFVDSFGGGTGALGTGAGFVHFQTAPVPESATALLFGLVLVPILRRRRRLSRTARVWRSA